MSDFTQFARTNAIKAVAGLFTSGEVFATLRKQAMALEAGDLSGPEKKAKLIEFAKEDLLDLAGWAFNLILELAVAYVKVAMEKQK